MESRVGGPLGLLEEHLGHCVDLVLFHSFLVPPEYLGGGVPLLVGFVFLLLGLEVQVQVLSLSDGGTEMQIHLRVEASAQTFLLRQLVVVEVGIEVRNRFICHVASLHAISKDHALSSVKIHILLVFVLGL